MWRCCCAMNKKRFDLIVLAASIAICGSATGAEPTKAEIAKTKPAKAAKAKVKQAYPMVGSVERLDPAINKLIPTNAVIEKLAEGFLWAEGPVWMGNYLLFSDIPTNRIYKWKEGEGISVFLENAGYAGGVTRGGEMGANGLTRDASGRLVMCQHGNRCIARLERDGRVTILAQYYKFCRFNSPNDLVYDRKGNLYFTDPPYGLEKGMDDPRKELLFQGVYRLSPSGEVTLLTDKLSRPNGIGLSPDQKTLYVNNSDEKSPCVMAFPILANGTLGPGRIFFDCSTLSNTGRKGLPDGLKVDVYGNVFSTGPGGVLVISPDGRHLGTILTGDLTANCAWGDDGRTLYMTVNHTLCRIRTSTRGLMP